MASIEVADLGYALPGGRLLFQDVSFRVGDAQHVALVGANGVGKSTLLKVIAGVERARHGHARVDGRVAYMPQFVAPKGATVRDLLLTMSGPTIVQAASALRRTEVGVGAGTRDAEMAYAHALSAWGDAGGYDAEVLWDTCCTVALGAPLRDVAQRAASSLSGGEQKRLVLELLLRGDAVVLLLDEPDNFLDIPGKQWLEEALNATPKTVLYVSHDRTLLERTAQKVVTLEGRGAWTHGGSFSDYHDARARRLENLDEEHRRFQEERDRLYESMREFKRRAALNPKFASRAQAAETKLRRFESQNAPPERPKEQDVRVRLRGGRTGKMVLRAKRLSFRGIVAPFDCEIYFGERVGVVGPNGSGKSHFLNLLAGRDIDHEGEWALGARVAPSLFSQLHERPDLEGWSLVDALGKQGIELNRGMAGLKRYGLVGAAWQPFETLSGGQQARFQLLMMEMANPTMLLLDEPTDNLDVDSADALERGLAGYEGTVVVVTHDRWFMRSLDRFLVFDAAGSVTGSLTTPYV